MYRNDAGAELQEYVIHIYIISWKNPFKCIISNEGSIDPMSDWKMMILFFVKGNSVQWSIDLSKLEIEKSLNFPCTNRWYLYHKEHFKTNGPSFSPETNPFSETWSVIACKTVTSPGRLGNKLSVKRKSFLILRHWSRQRVIRGKCTWTDTGDLIFSYLCTVNNKFQKSQIQ